MNLGFIVLYIEDMDRMRAFYADTLGLTVMDAISSPTFVTLRPPDGGALVGLQAKAASRLPPREEIAPGSVELSFAVEDVDATWRRWQDQGVTLLTAPLDLPFGRYFLAQDPEGHYLSVYRFAQPAT